MAVTTTIARHYAWRHGIMIFLCVGFAVWGGYDLWVKIPRNEQRFEQHQQVLRRIDEIQSLKQSRPLTAAEIQEAESLEARLKELAPNGVIPTKPGEYDRLTQWLFIASILFVPYFLVDLRSTVKRTYTLDDDGTLHLPAQTMPSSTWRREEIADIDMHRWMAKSIAWLVHTDGTRVKLDDYKHRNLHLIVGALAARLHPEQWTEEAKPVKPPEDEAPDSEAGGADTEAEPATAAAGAGEEDSQSGTAA